MIKILKHLPAIILNKILAKVYSTPIPVVLMYHSVSDAQFLSTIPFSLFRKQIDCLFRKKRRIITFDDISFKEINNKDVLLTFDDGYLDNYEVVYPLLDKYNYKAIVFITTGFIGKNLKIYRCFQSITLEKWQKVVCLK